MNTILSLCDLTGNFVRPWVEAGYDAVLVDPQHGFYAHGRRDVSGRRSPSRKPCHAIR